jgi:hypothetical protein
MGVLVGGTSVAVAGSNVVVGGTDVTAAGRSVLVGRTDVAAAESSVGVVAGAHPASRLTRRMNLANRSIWLMYHSIFSGTVSWWLSG